MYTYVYIDSVKVHSIVCTDHVVIAKAITTCTYIISKFVIKTLHNMTDEDE